MSKSLNRTYQTKPFTSSQLSEMSQSRIITKHLVYVIGISENLSKKDLLIKHEYFGQYGKIKKIIINKKKAYNLNNPFGPSYSVYVTYSKPYEASIAILALDNIYIDNHLIRASFGTTKYCQFFLKGLECTNKDCLFLHKCANESDIIKREDLNVNKNIFYKQQLYAIKIADIYNPDVKNKLLKQSKKNTKFPSPDLIYQNEIVIENEKYYKNSFINNKKNIKNEIKKNNKNDNLNKENIHISNGTNKIKKIYSEDKNENKNKNNDENKENNNINNTRNNLNKLEIDSIKKINNSNEITCSSTGDEKDKNSLILFTKKNKSRFNFVNNINNENLINENEIPEFILDIIEEKYKLNKLEKYFKNKDLLILNYIKSKNIINNNKDDNWSNFIINKNNHTFKNYRKKKNEFEKEINKINQFVLNQKN